ncbi:MAG: ABC transporter permease [Opitutaceae bacterium]|nr:ABC transporter permease [Opitutaceae bacterium]
MHSLPFAFRALLKTPGFTAVAVLTIAVAIGANTTLYSIFDRLMLNPVSFPEPERVVALWAVNNERNFVAPAVAWPRFDEIRREARSFASLADSCFDSQTLTGNGEPEQLTGLRVTANYFATLGLAPARGRDFRPEEDQPNGPGVAILSHEYWQTRFGGRANIVGESILLNGRPHEVIGIMPPRLTNPIGGVQVFVPRVFEPGGLTPAQVQVGAGYSQPVARLKPGVTREQANAELAALSRAYKERFATQLDADNQIEARFLTETLVQGIRPTMRMLLGAVACVLLIACANVASLFLGRLCARHKEIAVRQSLGATRGAIVWQFLAESLVFSVAAGGVGILLALWALSAIQQVVANQLPPNAELTLSWPALAATVTVTFVVSLLVGLFPALQASKPDLVEALKDASRGNVGSPRARHFRHGLIVLEVALSVVLLTGAGLLLRSFQRLQDIPPGFQPGGLALAFVGAPVQRYATPETQERLFADIVDQLKLVPQVRAASSAIGVPLTGNAPQAPYTVGTAAALPLSQRPLAGLRIVGEDYFTTLGIPLRQGRAFTAQDRLGAPLVCVINESFAKRLFPGESALGKQLRRGRDAEFAHQIVGVIGDVKSVGLAAPAPDEIYYPMRQLPRPGLTVVARTDGDPAALQAVIRTAVAAVDKDQPITFFNTMDGIMRQNLGFQRIVAALTGIFAGVALLLAAIGLYSVLAYSVAQRTSEIGIRMALGASSGQVLGMIVTQGMALVGIGLVAGLWGAYGAGALLASLLFQTTAFDLSIYAVVTVVFAAVALLACLLPARRAARIDPLVALRSE